MKFFDYKFLILLGLTLVVYFIYREVEYLRSKVDKLENEFKNNKLPAISPIVSSEIKELTQNINTTLPQVLPNKPDKPNEQKELIIKNDNLEKSQSPSSVKVITIDLSPSNNNSIPGIQIVQQNTNDNNNDNSDDENDNENENDNDTESSKHLAIYSNDNEQYDSTQNSLMESAEANKYAHDFDYSKMEIPDLKETMDTLINDLTSENNKTSTQDGINEIIDEKEKQLSELSNKSENKNKLDLNEMKIPELKKLAEQYKITITKKVNGQHRLKNKNELILEIQNKLNEN